MRGGAISYKIAALAAVLVLTGDAQRTQPPVSSETLFRSTTQEVLLDFVVRDKHHRLVTNLRPQEVEILEDGVPQKVRSLQYRGGLYQHDQLGETGAATRAAGANPAYSQLREINLVSLLFDGMGLQARRRAALAAKAFFGTELPPNTYIGVYVLNTRLALIQQYTHDIHLLRQAVDRVAGGTPGSFTNDIQMQAMLLNSLSSGEKGFQAMQPGSAQERGPISTASSPSDAAAASIERQMASLTIAILSSQVGNLSVDALKQLIHGQAQLPGRKTVIYFSEGLILPPGEPERFRALISDANRASIAFYTVDASGLDTLSRVSESNRINAALRTTEPDLSARSDNSNYQENLRNLAEDTGGSAIDNTNDMTAPLRRVMEEVRGHYEAAYAPASSTYDGRFRTIEVRITRPGLRVQHRKGYFAVPLLNGEPIAPFEFAALKAINSDPPPHAFDFHAATLRFRGDGEETEYLAVFSVPSRVLSFTEEAKSKVFRLHVSFLALVKDEHDQIVRKISRDLEFQAPSGKQTEFQRGETSVTLHLSLPPGLYHMEAVAIDQESQNASTRKVAFFVPAGHVGLSDLVFVRSIQRNSSGRNAVDPLDFAGGEVTPDLNPAVPKSPAALESLYFVLYPIAGIDSKPDVRIAITHDGKVLTAVRESLPEAEADGSIRVLSRIGLGGLDSGPYEIKVTATQGAATVTGSTVITII
jgi:VWFA-related protein